MQLCQLTPQQALPDVQIMPQEWKFDPEVSINHDDLCAGAWECDYERPIFDARYENAAPPNSPDSDMRSYLPTKGTCNTSCTPRERSPEVCLRRDEICDKKIRIPTRKLMWKRNRNNLNLLRLTPAVRNTVYVTNRSLNAMTINDINPWAAQVCSTERKRGRSKNFRT